MAVCLVAAGCTGETPRDRPSASSTSATVPSASPTPPAEPTPPAQPSGSPAVEEALAQLDRRAQVAQLFVVGVPLQGLDAGDALVRGGVGGVFLRGRSSAAAADLAAVTGRWAPAAPGPRPWVAVDQEGGQVQALSGPGFEPLPEAVEQGALPADQLAALADTMGAALRSAGVNLDLAPVVDVVPPGTESGNAPIGAFGRQYGGTAREVVRSAGAVARGLAAHGVTATLKHFPGLGRVAGNTDTTAGVTDTVTTRYDGQVAAFAALASARAEPFVMMSTAIYTQLDPTEVAAFSPVVVTGVLRDQLGFDGVVISDDLANAASVTHLPVAERALRFLAAGGTLVLTVDAATLSPMLEAVLARDAVDPAFSALVDDAVRTALEAKDRAGLLAP
jgi:beta-N-acetylhexosaminidase